VTSRTEDGLAYTREGRPGTDVPVLLLHAGIADRRMWDGIAPALAGSREVLRVDLRGFGESDRPWSPRGSHAGDVVEVLHELGIERAHIVGVSFGAGVAAEVTLVAPSMVASLLLVAPGGSLIAEATPELEAFWAEEEAALERGDLDAAAEANVRWWVVGPRRAADAVAPEIRRAVATMQRRAFEITADWGDDDEDELTPGALERLDEIGVPVLVLTGDLDLDAILLAADRLEHGLVHVRRERWSDTAHLPPLEHPDPFVELTQAWLAEVEAGTATA
jgi:pimeloyl-ACP methyl ester carboxylesterase